MLRASLIPLAVSAIVSVCAFSAGAMSGNGRPPSGAEARIVIRTDDESIALGRKLFDAKCGFCHTANSTEKTVGPGLKGIMKGEKLPASSKPATPENIAEQMNIPYQDMPSFSYLSEEDINNIIAYLNTL